MAGVERPEKVLIRGRNMFPLLQGRQQEWDENFYCEYSVHNSAKTHMRGYRTPNWKLMIDYLNDNRAELYDLQADPGETKNLYLSTDPRIVKARTHLTTKMHNRMREIKDPVYKLIEKD